MLDLEALSAIGAATVATPGTTRGGARKAADFELTALASKACGLIAAAITDLMACEDFRNPLGPRLPLAHSCGQVRACMQGLIHTGRLRRTRVAQARRLAGEVTRPHRALPDSLQEARQVIALRRAQSLTHELGARLDARLDAVAREAAEDAAGQWIEALEDLQAYGLMDADEMLDEEARFFAARLASVLHEGGVR